MERTSRLIAIAILAFIDLKEGRAGPSAPLEQRTESFTIKLHGAVSEVTPLFGPVQEEEWAPGWNPHFLHPAEGAQREGVVFTTPAQPDESGSGWSPLTMRGMVMLTMFSSRRVSRSIKSISRSNLMVAVNAKPSSLTDILLLPRMEIRK